MIHVRDDGDVANMIHTKCRATPGKRVAESVRATTNVKHGLELFCYKSATEAYFGGFNNLIMNT